VPRNIATSTLKQTTHGVWVFLLVVIQVSSIPDGVKAQSQPQVTLGNPVKFHVDVDPQLLGPEGLLPSPAPSPSQALPPVPGAAGAGLVITPTFDVSIDAATQAEIKNAIAFYQSDNYSDNRQHLFQ